jgi:PAS domain S-box-containing protein
MTDSDKDSHNFIENYKIIIENIHDLICIVGNKHPYDITFINKTSFLKELDYTNDELIGQSILSIIHPEDVKDFEILLKKGIDGESNSKNIRIKNKSKKFSWFQYNIRTFEDINNQKKFLIILKNSTQRKELEDKIKEHEIKFKNLISSIPEIRFWKLFYPKKYEEALKISYEMLQKVIDNIPQNIFWKDMNLMYLGCNQNYAKLIGAKTPDNVIGEKDKDLSLDKILGINKVMELEQKELSIIKSNEPEYRVIELWNFKNGNQVWFDINRIPLHDSEGNIAGLLVTYEDMSLLKKAELELIESEEKFRTISERSLLGIFIIQDDMIKYVNQRASRTLEYTIEEMKSWNPERYLQLFNPDDRDFIFKLASLLQQGKKSGRGNIQVRVRKKSGDLIWVEIFAQSINYQGTPAALISAIDITQRKKAEDQLIDSEAKYRHLFESSPNMICLVDAEINVMDVNTALLKFFKRKKEEFIGENFLEIFQFSKDTLKIIESKYTELLKRGYVKPIELKLYNDEGNLIWVSMQASFIETGIQTLIEIIMQDITERKLSEEILQLNEARLEALLKLSQIVDFSQKEIIEFAVLKSVELTKSHIGCLFLRSRDENVLKFYSCLNQIDKICQIKNEPGFFYNYFILRNRVIEEKKFIINNQFIDSDNIQICDIETQRKISRYLLIPIVDEGEVVLIAAVFNKETDYNDSDVHQLTLFMDGVWKTIQRKRDREALSNSEKKYRDLLETSSMGLLEYDFEINEYSYVNPKLLEMLGYDKDEELTVHKFRRSIYPEDIKKFHRAVNKDYLEFRIYDKQQNLKWFLGKSINQYDEQGNIISFRVWLEDITANKMYEELIYELNINFLNFTTDIRNNIEMLLETCRKLLNAEVVLYINKRVVDNVETYMLMTSEKETEIYNAKKFKDELIISELFLENHDYTQTIFNINKSSFAQTDPYLKKYNVEGCYGKLIKSQNEFNSAICVLYEKNPVVSHQDKLVLFLISDALEIEQRRWQVQQDLEQQSQLKTELLSRTSHELKTPLISIKGFTELLLTVYKKNLDTDMVSILDEIREGSNRLERLINSLLKSSKLDQGRLVLNRTTEDLSFLIKFCVKELYGLAELRNHKINLEVQEYLTCNLDKERIYEVITNLLLNAIKYTPPGGEITIKSEIKEKNYVISVNDNGIGITEEETKKLFKQFGKIERYGKGWDVDIEGSGLGLYISKKIIDLHGGEIWVESEGRNKGSTFSFSLPIISE